MCRGRAGDVAPIGLVESSWVSLRSCGMAAATVMRLLRVNRNLLWEFPTCSDNSEQLVCSVSLLNGPLLALGLAACCTRGTVAELDWAEGGVVEGGVARLLGDIAVWVDDDCEGFGGHCSSESLLSVRVALCLNSSKLREQKENLLCH